MNVPDNATQQLKDMIDQIKNPNEGELVISDPCVMETCAFYVGQICAEYSNDYGWLFQPYARLTDYFESKETAQSWLDSFIESEKED
jgi:hypothetical protein